MSYRYLLRKFNYFSIAFLPGFFAGLSFALFKPKLRVQILTAFSNAVSCGSILILFETLLVLLILLQFFFFFLYRHSKRSL